MANKEETSISSALTRAGSRAASAAQAPGPGGVAPQRRRRITLRGAFFGYLLLLLLCWVVREARAPAVATVPAELTAIELPVIARGVADAGTAAGSPGGATVRVAWRTWGSPPDAVSSRPPIVLLHGSPGSHRDFTGLAPQLAAAGFWVLAPDLPGFGASTLELPDYSIDAHARYLHHWLDALDAAERAAGRPALDQIHLLGFSMGGAVAVTFADHWPDRVASLVLLSATGVQELELLGDYQLNHLVHGAQLALIRGIGYVIPHLGGLDRGLGMLDVSYARNFYDSDQRPLRAAISRLAMPVLIVHGATDPLVPELAAREHHRLVAQSELALLPTDHFVVFREPELIASQLLPFFDRVDQGVAVTRAAADPSRLEAAAAPFDPKALPPLSGLALVVVMLVLAVTTFISEDLTTIGAGLLVATGRLTFWSASLACFLGIYLGDLLLFLLGRWLGRRAIATPPLSWWISAEKVATSSAWFRQRGAAVIFLSRFLPGTRLPTYVAAGILHTPFWGFAGLFFLASAVWTPALVAFSWWVGAAAIDRLAWAQQHALGLFALAVATMLLIRGLLLPMFSWGGRRRLVGKLHRITRWEFWPPWAFYPPIVAWVAWLALRYRGLTVFTAANPGIPTGGFIGESKAEILTNLSGAAAHLPRWELLPPPTPLALTVAEITHAPQGGDHLDRLDSSEPSSSESDALAQDVQRRLDRVESFRVAHQLDYPLVLKPNAGQRGSGVAVVRSVAEVADYLRHTRVATLVQEYVPGIEVGIFYIRHPDETTGRIFSVTEKVLPSVVGDGKSSLETLILKDDRAVAMADFYLERQGERRWTVPAAGERVELVELGTHCRGAIFLDGREVVTAELSATVDAVSKTFAGFYFGRYDVRAPSLEALGRGDFKVIELNGVTSEATSIYDPRHSLTEAWATLFEQWRLCFAIGAWHRARGVRPTSLGELLRGLLAYRREQRSHPSPPVPAAVGGAASGPSHPDANRGSAGDGLKR